MTHGGRLALMILAALVLIPASIKLAATMPTFGAHPLPYGDAINDLAPKERSVTNTVTAVNFDYRGFDTLGEEFMLLAAVTGTVVLLRGSRGEDLTRKPGIVVGRTVPRRADAVVLVSRILAPLILVFGIYVCVHATTTPGGGFQGGVITATSLLMAYLGETYPGWRRIVRSQALDWSEAGGALLFAVMGFAPLVLGRPFMSNILPFGTMKSAWSGGSMVVENIGVAFAVTGSFALVFLEFMEETRRYEQGDTEPGSGEDHA